MATLKQKKAIKRVVENGGNVSRAMIESGYSKNTAKTPQKLTESKAWLELIEKELPDSKLAKVHKEGLAATHKQPRIVDRDKRGAPIYDYVSEPDFNARHKYLETAYKIKGKTLDIEKDKPIFMPLQINFIVDDKPPSQHQNIVEAAGSDVDTKGQDN